MGQIVYRSGVVFFGGGSRMPQWAEDRLSGYMDDAGVDVLQVSSGYRYPGDQARIMIDNINAHGLSSQYELYGSTGDSVLDAYSASASRATNIANMAAKIREIGPEKVSRHMAEDAVVFDIAPSSVTGGIEGLKARMKAAPQNAQWRRDPGTLYEIGELLYPPKDPALHVEFPNSSASIPQSDEEGSSGLGVADVVGGGLALAVAYKVGKHLLNRRR